MQTQQSKIFTNQNTPPKTDAPGGGNVSTECVHSWGAGLCGTAPPQAPGKLVTPLGAAITQLAVMLDRVPVGWSFGVYCPNLLDTGLVLLLHGFAGGEDIPSPPEDGGQNLHKKP